MLNNNGVLVYHNETGREMILLGNGVGFGKKPAQQIEQISGAKIYTLVTRKKEQSVLKVVNGINLDLSRQRAGLLKKPRKCFRR